MAVAIASVTTLKQQTRNPSMSVTVSAGSSLCLYAIISGFPASTTMTNPTATYGAVAMTRLALSADSSGGDKIALFRLLNPAVGTTTLATAAAGGTGAAANALHLGALVCTGVHQTTPDGTPNTAVSGATGTASTVNIASAVGELVIDATCMGADVTSITAGAGQTDATVPASPHWALNSGLGWGEAWASSREAGAASVTMSWSWTTAAGWAIAGVSIKPDVASVFVFQPAPMWPHRAM